MNPEDQLESIERRRPGGRSERVRQAIRQAVLDLLIEQGPNAISLPAVARRAGVTKSTVYRWWKTPAELTRETLETLENPALPEVDTGAWESDVREFCRTFTRFIQNPAAAAFMRAIIAMRPSDPSLGAWIDEFWSSRRSLWLIILERAISRGELAESARQVPLIELISGPLLLTHLVTDLRLSLDEVDEVAATIASGVSARHSARGHRTTRKNQKR